MTLYLVAIAIHVVVAVLGIGVVGAVPLTARLARKGGTLGSPEGLLGALLFAMQVGFFAMLLTGVLLDVSMGAREAALASVERWGWTMCAGVAVITLLMQTKPLP